MAQKTGMVKRQGAVRANKGPARINNGTQAQPKMKPPASSAGRGSGRASSGLQASPSKGVTPASTVAPVKANAGPRGVVLKSPSTMVVKGGSSMSHQGAGEAKANAGFSKHARKPG